MLATYLIFFYTNEGGMFFFGALSANIMRSDRDAK